MENSLRDVDQLQPSNLPHTIAEALGTETSALREGMQYNKLQKIKWQEDSSRIEAGLLLLQKCYNVTKILT